MTEERLLEIEARAAAATPGPWRPGLVGHSATIEDPDGRIVCYWYPGSCIPSEEAAPNLDFIEFAREDVPALIAALREAWAVRDLAIAKRAAESEWDQLAEIPHEEAQWDAARERYNAAKKAFDSALSDCLCRDG